MDVVVGWPGSVADGRIWSNSGLRQRIDEFFRWLPSHPVPTKRTEASEMVQEEVPSFILADSAYPSNQRMVPTFRPTDCKNCPVTKKLNEKLASVRYCIEMAFGRCKGRFRILNRPIECARDDVTRATRLISAVLTLHNFLITVEDDTVFDNVHNTDELDEDDVDNVDMTDGDEDTCTRTVLLRYARWQIDAGIIR